MGVLESIRRFTTLEWEYQNQLGGSQHWNGSAGINDGGSQHWNGSVRINDGGSQHWTLLPHNSDVRGGCLAHCVEKKKIPSEGNTSLHGEAHWTALHSQLSWMKGKWNAI